jgi:hypothetical protein
MHDVTADTAAQFTCKVIRIRGPSVGLHVGSRMQTRHRGVGVTPSKQAQRYKATELRTSQHSVHPMSVLARASADASQYLLPVNPVLPHA